MAHTQIEIKTSWGETIYGNAWTVDEKNTTPVANVIIAHGMAEHSFRYDELARYLNSAGYNVYAVDQPGHGLNVSATDKPRLGLGVWPASGFKLAINYLHELIIHVRLNMLPTILLGHSMGSFVSQRYYQRFSDTLDGLILSGSSANNSTFVLGRTVSKIMNKFMSDRKRVLHLNSLKTINCANLIESLKLLKMVINHLIDGYRQTKKMFNVLIKILSVVLPVLSVFISTYSMV